VGDLDSLENKEDWAKKTSVIELEEQESTDFEKCLYASEAPITIALGMSGKRLDHTLAALDVLVRYSANRALVIVSETDLILVGRGPFEFEVNRGARVSVHPVMPIKFASSKGLKFALEGVALAPGVKTGTSNRAVSGMFEIVPAKNQTAPYLVIIEKEYLQKWMKD
jgi:thiamine pyrophosphokinase